MPRRRSNRRRKAVHTVDLHAPVRAYGRGAFDGAVVREVGRSHKTGAHVAVRVFHDRRIFYHVHDGPGSASRVESVAASISDAAVGGHGAARSGRGRLLCRLYRLRAERA